MPASLAAEMNSHASGLEDQRALQIALELSKLGLSPENENPSAPNPGLPTPPPPYDREPAMKKSANMTECVPVPSSEHVAEIVGRQGCKIKALRAKTNTYIKTPVRGEEPVFVVTGRKEDVGAAKKEILSAADHFSQIRASRRNNNSVGGTVGNLPPGPPSPITPGQVTIQVRVPYKVVGLVVGPKGATIKRIQQQTHTYIVTPSRDKEPIFEVTGLPESVDKAKQEIESHIANRTGGMVDGQGGPPLTPHTNNINSMHMPPSGNGHNGSNRNHGNEHNDFHQNGIDAGFHEINGDMMSSMYKPPSSNSAFTSYSTLNHSNNILSQQSAATEPSNIFAFPPAAPAMNGAKMGEFSAHNNGYSGPGYSGLYESSDEGIGSPTLDNGHMGAAPTGTSIWSSAGMGDAENGSLSAVFAPIHGGVGAAVAHRSSSMPGNNSFSPTLAAADHSSVRRIHSDPSSGAGAGLSAFMPLTPGGGSQSGTSASISSSTSASPTDSTGSLGRRRCLVCEENLVVAALVPCGHNLFCVECANLILEKPESERQCPICQQTPTQAIRIFS